MREWDDLIRRGGLWVAAQLVALIVAFGLPFAVPSAWVPWPTSLAGPVRWVGWVVLASGLFLAFAGLAALGKDLTPLPEPREGGSLRTGGVYGLVRHPIYGGIVLAALGVSLQSGSILGMSGALVALGFFDLKARAEEQRLESAYPDYTAYRRRTKRLIPGLY